jgi:hypothetical protein
MLSFLIIVDFKKLQRELSTVFLSWLNLIEKKMSISNYFPPYVKNNHAKVNVSLTFSSAYLDNYY